LATYGKYPTLTGIYNFNTYHEYFIGWNGKAWTFPVWGERLQITGMQVRFPDGVKCSVTGTQVGVFVPKTIMAHNGIIGVAEGLSDAMAACELGIKTVGKWNSDNPHETLLTLIIEKFKPSKGILIFADNDDPGQKGAAELRRLLKTYLPNLHQKTITPPQGIKDIREWRTKGLTSNTIYNIIYGKRES
jgi:5S rRNA maturation endonuclease (ribonuclease M5)